MDALSPLLAAFASAFTQEHRLFSLRFTQAHFDAELLPHTLGGEEHVSAPFDFHVECLSDNAHIELKTLLGVGVDIALSLQDGGERVISGIITRAQHLGSDGGFARYGLNVEPALAALKLRRNSRVFQDKSVVDIVGLILDEHIDNNPVFAQCFRHREALTHAHSSRSFCQQYRESDFVFIERLLREEGISYFFDSGNEVGLHTLVLFDSGSDLPMSTQSDIRFHRAHATEADDTITEWTAHRQIRSGAAALASFDYKAVSTQQGSDQSRIDQGEAGSGLVRNLDDYDPQSLYYSSGDSALKHYATLRQRAKDMETKRFAGGGVVRALGAGQWFTLHEHPAHEDDGVSDRQFVVLSQTISARNNLPGEFDGVAQTQSIDAPAVDEPGYRNSFTAVRKNVPIVPVYAHTDHAKPTARGQQTATVVGPAGEEIFCDEHGRIKIQFHWARPQDHDQGKHGASAEKNDFSSCWVRVMMPSAGAGYGHQFLPRIGQEVLVDFIEGDIDRPIVLRALHNGQQTPPTFQNAGSLPANKTLSGIKSREYKGSRHNEIVFDNTTNETRTTLSTEHGKTQLHQGYLIHPRSEGLGTPRGEGFELRTDNAGAIRAAQGLLISTEAQPNANGKQLDRADLNAQLQAAQNLTQQLGDTAKSQHADAPTLDPKLNAEQLDHKKPYLYLHGHGGLAITTPQSAAIVTGKNFDQISQRDTHQAAGRRWIHNAGESISLFVANAQNKIKESIKLIAAKGNVLVQAQGGSVEITADKKITITAAKENLTATAGKEFLLQAGGGYIRISGGNVEIHCPGTLSMKASSFSHVSGGGAAVDIPTMPTASIMSVNFFPSARSPTLSDFVKPPESSSALYIGGQANSSPAVTSNSSIPATPSDTPTNLDFSHLQPQFDSLWEKSFPEGKAQEHGGTLVKNSDGLINLTNTGSGEAGSFSPNLNVAKGESITGVFHTHPYDQSEGGYTGVSLSGGDAAYLINNKQDVIIAQSGKEQFAYLRTSETPSTIDYVKLNDGQNERVYQLMDEGMDFSTASKKAAIETAKDNGLAYYEGLNGALKRVFP